MTTHIITQNVHHLSPEKEAELVESMQDRGVFAACLQETWIKGNQQWSTPEGYVFITHTHKTEYKGNGVALVLSPQATRAWGRMGQPITRHGPRILSVRLKLVDKHAHRRYVTLVSAYAPHSGRSQSDRDAFHLSLQECISACPSSDILVIGSDTNASVGVRCETSPDRVRGPNGIPHVNDAGATLHDLLSMNDLCLPTTFFQKKMARYRTWTNFRSGLPHQIDHFIVKRRDLIRVHDAVTIDSGVDSDHKALQLRLNLEMFCPKASAHRIKYNINRDLLNDPAVASAFTTSVVDACRTGSGVSPPSAEDRYTTMLEAMKRAEKAHLMSPDDRRPSWYRADKETLNRLVSTRNTCRRTLNDDPLSQPAKGAYRRARNRLKRQVRRAKANWITSVADDINEMRNVGGGRLTPRQTWKCVRTLAKGPRTVTALHPMSLKKATGEKCQTPEENRETMVGFLRGLYSKTATFDPAAVTALPQRKVQKWMDRTPTLEEITRATNKLKNGKSGGDAKVPVEYYKALMADPDSASVVVDLITAFWRTGAHQEPGDSEVHRKPRVPTLALAYTENWRVEFDSDNVRRRNTKAHRRYERYKRATTIAQAIASGATSEDLETDYLDGRIILYDPLESPEVPTLGLRADDTDGLRYPQWETARLTLLPKKGDLQLCKNWRGVSLLDVGSKIFSTIVVGRLMKLMEEVAPEEQNGFRPRRSTVDGSFTVNMILRKRREHNMETWALFIDLVKAFDTVPHRALFAVLRRYGVPDHCLNIIIRLHDRAKLIVEIAGEDSTIDVTIGVRQGSCEGPILFLFYMNAALETLEWPASIGRPTFAFDRKAGPTGVNSRRKACHLYEVWHSLFADDCGVFFETRTDLVLGSQVLFDHLKRFGLLMHVGRGTTSSKSEAMFIPKPGNPYSAGDTSRYSLDGDGFIDFVEKFKYLGSVIVPDLTATADVDNRVKSASAAFAQLRHIFRNRTVTPATKGVIYDAIITSTLLYGCETWNLLAADLRRLRNLHRRCVREIFRVTMRRTWKDRIKSDHLNALIGVRNLEDSYQDRLLRWVGVLCRMSFDRLPRRLMTSWVQRPRLSGGQQKTWGKTVTSVLKTRGLPTDFQAWNALAQDKSKWRSATRSTIPPPPPGWKKHLILGGRRVAKRKTPPVT